MNDSSTKKASAIEIVKRLKNAGFRSLIVGGAVRDMVMGREPEDYDIATSAAQSDIERLFERVYPVGSKFGVSLVVIGPDTFEIATFRKDGVYIDGRRPSYVEPAGEIEDTERRDFTINALFYDPVADKIIDHAGGVQDIRDRLIRAVGDPRERLTEDKLRMLRAVRFAARFLFTIEPSTAAVIKEYAPSVIDVSYERIGRELSKIFCGPNSGYALTLLDETGLLRIVLPEIHALHGVEQPPDYHPEGDVFEHTRRMLELFDGGTETLAFGILLHDIAKPDTLSRSDRVRFTRHDEVGAKMTVQILKRLRFPNQTTSRVEMLVRNHMRFINIRRMRRSKLLRFIAQDGFDELLELYRLDCLASNGNLEDYEFAVKTVQEEKRSNNDIILPDPLLAGDDLIALGYEPGPVFGTILQAVRDKQLEGEVVSRDEAINFVRQMFPF